MTYFLISVTLVICIEIAHKLPFAGILSRLKNSMVEVIGVLQDSSLDDSEKEKRLLRFSLGTSILSFKLLICMLATFSPILVTAFISKFYEYNFIDLIVSQEAGLYSIVFALIYSYPRFWLFK